jgi:lipoate-protein ligase A
MHPTLAPDPLLTWYVLRSEAGEHDYNMALDEALLEAMPRLRLAVLRFYSWKNPAASFGYFQKYAEVERITLLRPLVRRPTGGGVVPHGQDWTYSVAVSTIHPWYHAKAPESYRLVHEWIRAAFLVLGVVTELAPVSAKAQLGQCFVGYEKSDVLWQGRKIAGAAQRRTRDGLLIQGSVQPPPIPLRRAEWEKAMCGGTSAGQPGNCVEWELDVVLNERALKLVEEKYGHASYNMKR